MDAHPRTVRLSGQAALRDAESLAQEMRGALKEADVRVETEALESADVSLIQILLAGFRSAKSLDRRFSVAMPADGALAAQMTRLGIDIHSLERVDDEVVGLGGAWL